MTQEATDPTAPQEPVEVVEAEIVSPEAPAAEPSVVEATIVETPTTPEAPAAEWIAEVPSAQPQYVVVEAPRLPRKAGNRGVGSLLAVVGALLFAGLLVGATYLVGAAGSPRPDAALLAFLTNLKFYLPIVLFLVAFVLLVLLANRAQWWAYILGSLLVGAAVYFGTAGLGVLLDQAFAGVTTSFADGLRSPFVIIAGLLAREVAVWWGSLIAHRGKRVTARNRVAREVFDQELADFRAKYGAV